MGTADLMAALDAYAGSAARSAWIEAIETQERGDGWTAFTLPYQERRLPLVGDTEIAGFEWARNFFYPAFSDYIDDTRAMVNGDPEITRGILAQVIDGYDEHAGLCACDREPDGDPFHALAHLGAEQVLGAIEGTHAFAARVVANADEEDADEGDPQG